MFYTNILGLFPGNIYLFICSMEGIWSIGSLIENTRLYTNIMRWGNGRTRGNKYRAGGCKREWPSENTFWTAQFSYMWVWKIGGKEKVHAFWVSWHQEINEKMRGDLYAWNRALFDVLLWDPRRNKIRKGFHWLIRLLTLAVIWWLDSD